MKPVASSEEGRRYRVPAAARVLALIEFLAAARTPIGVSETARQMGIPKSSCFALMMTLEQVGYARRDEQDEWTLTLRIYHVGISAAKKVDIQAAAQPVLTDLCEATGLTSHLGLFDGTSMIYALKVDPPGGMVKFETYPGKHASPHLTAIGRAIASMMPKADLEALLDGYKFTGGDNPKIRSRSSFTNELRAIRRRGYAIEMEEETVGVGCIAAPVIHAGAAAIGVAALAGQIKDKSVETISAAVIDAAARLSAVLGEP